MSQLAPAILSRCWDTFRSKAVSEVHHASMHCCCRRRARGLLQVPADLAPSLAFLLLLLLLPCAARWSYCVWFHRQLFLGRGKQCRGPICNLWRGNHALASCGLSRGRCYKLS